MDSKLKSEIPTTDEDKLLDSVFQNDTEAVIKLLESGVDIHCRDESVLYVAGANSNVEMIKLLLKYGADLDKAGNGALLEALYSKNEEAIRFFINAGVNIKNVKSDLRFISRFPLDLINFLQDSGLELNNQMLINAVHNNNIIFFKYAYDQLKVNVADIWKLAYQSEADDIMEYLLDLETDLDFSDDALLHYVLIYSKISILKKILNRIPDHRSFLTEGSLQLACTSGQPELIKLLLDLGFDPNENSKRLSLTVPIEIVLLLNKKILLENFKLLLEYGAKVTHRCLLLASKTDHLGVFELIYHSREWTIDQISDALYSAITNGTSIEFWCYIHELIEDISGVDKFDINFGLGKVHLKLIIDYCRTELDLDTFDYFVNIYGVDRIKPLIDLNNCDQIFRTYLEKIDFY